jgi:hypothetical protein
VDRAWRWIVLIAAVLAILALLAFARGTPEHAEPTAPAGVVLAITA